MRVTEPYTIFPRTLQSGKTVYYYQFRDEEGRRSSAKSTGCTTLSAAKRFCNKLYNSGELTKTTSYTFSIFTKDFFTKNSEWYKWKIINNNKITDETILSYNKFLNNQIIPFFGEKKISDITRSDIKNWIIWASEKWSAKTINNAQSVLNIILNQAVEKEIIKFNPALGLSFRKTEKKERELLTIREIKNIYNSPKWSLEILRKAFLLDCITGMRISEIAALRPCDIHDNFIDVAHSYSRQFGLGNTKTKIKRYVPKPTELDLSCDTEWIFQVKNGKPFNICRMHDNIMSICKDLGIDTKARGITTHTLRNFFISYLESENVPEPKIRAVAGHKDQTMTGLYTYWTPEMFPEVYEAQLKLYKQITGGEK
ncbi:MAG: tyrosine-type recombinase/integrase family protein [Treponema sp.]|nr:tyrosine-type recombinase/integrase family protein [Treponema sp.]